MSPKLMNLLMMCVFLALLFPAQGAEVDPPSSSSIDGTWRWTFTMPDGTISHPKLILETENGTLTGTSSFRPGTEAPITNAVLSGNQVRFQIVRQRAGREIVTTYWGAWSGKIIRGKMASNWAGEIQTYDWEARRAHEGAEGLWRWTISLRGRRLEDRAKLEQNGEVLTGTVPGFGRARRVAISHGSIKEGEVYFEVERGTGENKVKSIYRGKQTGDTIKGTIETHVGGRKQEAIWSARRAE